jgi:DNA-3-methyladenine glycosylase II
MGLPVTVHGAVEWLAFAISSQQISQIAATAIFHRLQAALGGTISPDAIDAADDTTLRTAGLSGNKIRGFRGLAEHVRTGRLETERFGTMTDDELFAQLVAVPDIGPWSAQVFMMGYTHRPDVFPAADVGLRAAVAVLDELPKPVTAKAAELRSATWRPYRSYASRYLWGLVRAVP